MKTCFKCAECKPLTEFYRHAMMADGHLNKCKACTRLDVYKHRHGKNREQVLQYDRLRAKLPERIENTKRQTERWRKHFTDKLKAVQALNNAVRSGKVLKWPICALPECNKSPEAHHPNYDAPLDVVWLCSAHHKQAHALARTK